ncbi:hypothetical protein PFNF135_00201 [Plasmodium falciparum NF135/5.C10]|uniref:Uncharacterized protein n=1 Tax=Plasmodium falciparum NF135/5.C10 TaxID=1036726 RepID=W4IQH5_PLAFA|nr:hypothetical protein PFNF135_00201 [Plasmodium falciparum NF135/5.C10]
MSLYMNIFEQIEIILEKCNNETFIKINTLIDHIIRNYANENMKEIHERKKGNDNNNKKKKKKKKENNTNTIRNYFNLVDKENNLKNNNNNDDGVTNVMEQDKNKDCLLSLTIKNNNNKTIINMFFFFGHFNIMIIIYYVIYKLKMFDKDLFIHEKNSNIHTNQSYTADSISDDLNKVGSDNNRNKNIIMRHTNINNKEHYLQKKYNIQDDEEEDNETIRSDSKLRDIYSDSQSKDIMMSSSPNKEEESMSSDNHNKDINSSDNQNKDINSSDHNMNDSTNESTTTSLSTSINNTNRNKKNRKKNNININNNNNNNNNSNNINSSSNNNSGVYHYLPSQKYNNKYNTYNNKDHIIYHNKCITHILCSQLMYLDMNSFNQAIQDIVKTNKYKLLRIIILEAFDSLNEYYRKNFLNKLKKCNVLIFIHSTHALNDTFLHNCLYIRIPKPDKILFNNHILDFLKTNYKINNLNNQKKQYIINVLNYCNFDIPLILALLYIIQLHKFPDIKKIIKLIINSNIKKLINVIHKCIISNNSFFVIRNILYNILYTYNFHLHNFLNTFCKELAAYHKNDNNYKKDLYALFSKYTYITSMHDMHICSLENLCSNIILLEKKYAKTFNEVDTNSEDTEDFSINIKLEE